MDSNIDPSIAELDLFHVSSSLERTNKHPGGLSGDDDEKVDEDHVSIPNVFRLNEYVADHHHAHPNNEHHDDNSTTAAALNMIQFNNFEDTHVENSNNKREGHGGHFNNFSEEQILHDSAHPYEIDHPKNASVVKVVPYNPSEKTKRLGRPRKNLTNTLATPENSSSQNYNEAIVSKFRLDRLPLEGPGSRGGKLGARRSPRGRVTSGSIRKRKQQALLGSMTSVDANGNMSSKVTLLTDILKTQEPNERNDETNDAELIDVSQGDINDAEIVPPQPKQTYSKQLTPTETKDDENVPVNSNAGRSMDKSVTQDIAEVVKKSQDLQTEKEATSTPRPKKRTASNTKTGVSSQKKGRTFRGSSRVTATSRTTVRNNRHRTTRYLPGPLIGLYYDLYDDNILEAQQNLEAASEKLALGFPIMKSPYAGDILYIISYLNKFKEVVFGDKVENLGPQDIESGLSLPPVEGGSGMNQKFNSKAQEASNKYDSTYISPTINKLFSRLLTLVLNRKKEVNHMTPSKAIAELRSMSLYLGLPKEWRDDSHVLNRRKAAFAKDTEPVDDENPEILSNENYTYELPSASSNPFNSCPDFESLGLKGILNPIDRLLMIRSLMQWSLTISDSIKIFITQNLQNQDVSGEKETSYVARSILKGFKNTDEVRRESELKINKKSTGVQNDSRESPENDLVAKYVDPTSDPLAHSMSLRLDELFVGDVGFNIGRFYLCRMADTYNGGLASMKKMNFTWKNINEIASSLPSKFKLYVQDVHQMLADTLTKEGVEFDDNGEEVEIETPENNIYWYEVASNAAELSEFVKFLSLKLDFDSSSDPVIRLSKTSMIYKPVLNLHNYLFSSVPLIANQEKLSTESRSLRNKAVDYKYNYATNLDQDEDEEEIVIEHVEVEKGDDDDYEEEEDGNDDQDY